ncbi:hypothetical protein AALB53_08165 [Lachnospiraceae bacterium 47-T17]
MNDEVVLEEYNDYEFRQEMMKSVEYPSVFLTGISTLEELNFFKNRPYSENYSLPLYSIVDGQVYKIGMLDLSLDSLLSLRVIFNYEVVLLSDKDNSINLNLNDADTLIKFIKL